MDKGATVRILIASSRGIIRDSLRKLLETERHFRVVGEAAEVAEAVKATRQLKPDILVVDLAAPHYTDFEALRELESSSVSVRALLLTDGIEKDLLIQALRVGARGIVLKESTTQLLIKAIYSVMTGQYWLGRESVSSLIDVLRDVLYGRNGGQTQKAFGLTPRQLQIVSTVVAGYSNRDIAKKFSLSENTVKHHLTDIFDKLGVSSRLELALFAVNHDLLGQLSPDEYAPVSPGLSLSLPTPRRPYLGHRRVLGPRQLALGRIAPRRA